MKTQVFGCPNCNQQFQVLPAQAGQVVQCPSCEQQVSIPENAFPDSKSESVISIAVRDTADASDIDSIGFKPIDRTRPAVEKPDSIGLSEANAENPEGVGSATRSPISNQPEPIDHLLPPRFDVPDPSRLVFRDNQSTKVFLPDGIGGQKQIDQRVLHIEHGGEKIALVALTPRQKLRRRVIVNLIAVLIGIAILAIVFKLLVP